MPKAVWGNDCLFKVNINGNMTPLVCAESFKMNVTTTPIDTTSFGNGYYKDYDYQAITYTLEFQGINRMPDNADGMNTVWDILDAQMGAVDYEYEMWFVDPDNVIRVVSGRVIVLGTELVAGFNQFASYTVQMQGCGEFFIRDTACDAHIDLATGTRATYDGSGFDVFHVHLSGISPETQVITYSINDAPEVELDSYVTGTTTFDFDVSVPHIHNSTLTISAKCNDISTGVISNYTLDPTRTTF